MKYARRYTNNKKLFYDIRERKVVPKKGDFTVTLDSKLELECFQILEKYWDSTVINVHVPAKICDPVLPCFPRGRDWRIDFRIPTNLHQPPLWIEAKGIFDDGFLLKMMLLSQNNPSVFENLVIVYGDRSTPPKWTKDLKIIPVSKFDCYLANLA